MGVTRVAIFGATGYGGIELVRLLLDHPEVVRRLIPADYCRGNIMAASSSQIPNLLHPDASRCASLGLRMPFMRGGEVIILHGMDAAYPALRCALPREQPVFSIHSCSSPRSPA